MIRKARVLLLGILLVVIGGCIGRPVFTVEVYTTPPASPVDSEPLTAAPGSIPARTPALLSPPTAAAMPLNFSPILYGKRYDANTFFILLGGVHGGQWLNPDQAAAFIGSAGEYDLYTLADGSFQVRGEAPEFIPRTGSYSIGTDVTRDAFGMVGVADEWPVRQGNAQELAPGNEIYRQAVLD